MATASARFAHRPHHPGYTFVVFSFYPAVSGAGDAFDTRLIPRTGCAATLREQAR
jgi:hypothetical protein